MENAELMYLSKDVAKKLEHTFVDIEKSINEFLNSPISLMKKERTIELLYLLQLYKNGYIGADPRASERLIVSAILILHSKTEEECEEKLKQLENVVNILKTAETNPLATAKRILEDKEKYAGVMF